MIIIIFFMNKKSKLNITDFFDGNLDRGWFYTGSHDCSNLYIGDYFFMIFKWYVRKVRWVS